MNITAYFVRKITAIAKHSDGSHWIDMEIHEKSPHGTDRVSAICLFTEGRDAQALVNKYVAAIDAVNAEIEAEAKEDAAA